MIDHPAIRVNRPDYEANHHAFGDAHPDCMTNHCDDGVETLVVVVGAYLAHAANSYACKGKDHHETPEKHPYSAKNNHHTAANGPPVGLGTGLTFYPSEW